MTIGKDSVEIGVPHTSRVDSLPARLVILAGVNRPMRDLADELDAMGIAYSTAGDMLGRSDLLSAIHGGAELGRTV